MPLNADHDGPGSLINWLLPQNATFRTGSSFRKIILCLVVLRTMLFNDAHSSSGITPRQRPLAIFSSPSRARPLHWPDRLATIDAQLTPLHPAP